MTKLDIALARIAQLESERNDLRHKIVVARTALLQAKKCLDGFGLDWLAKSDDPIEAALALTDGVEA